MSNEALACLIVVGLVLAVVAVIGMLGCTEGVAC